MVIKTKLIEGTNSYEIRDKELNEYIGEVALEGVETLDEYKLGQKYKFTHSRIMTIKELEAVVKFMKRKQKEFDNTMS